MRRLMFAALSILLCASAYAAGGSGQRVIELDGTHNTRDIGGYEAADGRHLRWGQVIRSDNLATLTRSDFARLAALGVRTIIDLRTPAERERDPTVWQGENPPEIFTIPVGRDDGEWMIELNNMLRSGRFTAKRATKQMIEGYQLVSSLEEDEFRRVMELVLDEVRRPILIHCTSGKDRTGVVVVLILEALGVNRDVIKEDYLLTNEVARVNEQTKVVAKKYADAARNVGSRRRASTPPPKAFLPLVGVTPEMLEAFYEGVEKKFGSMDAYLTNLGVGPAKRAALADSLTE